MGLSGGLFGHPPPYISKPASAFRLLQGPGVGWPEEGTRDGARDLQQTWCAANLFLLRSSKTSLPSPHGHLLDVMVWGTEKYKEPSSSTPGHHTHHLPTPFPCSLLRCTRKKTQPRPVASPDVSPSLKKRPTPLIPAPLYPFKSRFLRKLSMDTTWAPSASPCSSLTGHPHVFCLLKRADEMLELLAVDKLAANY